MKNFDDIICFTDGSCCKNGKPGATAGIGIYYPCKEFEDVSDTFVLAPITSQRAELYAIYCALKNITENCKFKKLFIYTDSLYSINSLTVWNEKWQQNNWIGTNKKEVKNLDIIKPISEILKKYEKKIVFTHVDGHNNKGAKEGDINAIFNKRVDKLACEGTKKNENNNMIV
jgi:ribonuclease HI